MTDIRTQTGDYLAQEHNGYTYVHTSIHTNAKEPRITISCLAQQLISYTMHPTTTPQTPVTSLPCTQVWGENNASVRVYIRMLRQGHNSCNTHRLNSTRYLMCHSLYTAKFCHLPQGLLAKACSTPTSHDPCIPHTCETNYTSGIVAFTCTATM